MRSRNEPIAIVGSGCRFPGGVQSPSQLWELLEKPRDVQSQLPSERLQVDGFYHPERTHHGSFNVKRAYTLSEDIRLFDAQFFNIKPVEAESIDPQHRLLLETVYEGIESAGMSMEELKGSQTAVYVGVMNADYESMMMSDLDNAPQYAGTGTARSILSNRVSYFFDWHGPSMTIDTACSSSLVAMHEAVQFLRSGDGRVAVAAGVNLLLGPEFFVSTTSLSMLSPEGRSRMWDERANGYARGDGFAAVVLKPLSAALEDGDYIECIVRETGVNQDGKTKGITMPSAVAQARLIRDTYAKCGLDPRRREDRCQYFEAHGTGTPAGDPNEASAIAQAFFDVDAPRQPGEDPLYVGSIKTIVGHTEGTAGLAGVLKASLAMRAGIIPVNMLLERLSPSVEPFYKNLQILTTPRPWPVLPEGTNRRASVNSFGFGGTNAHCILESYEPARRPPAIQQRVSTPFVFSAVSERSLRITLERYSAYLQDHPSTNLRDLSWTLNSRRSVLPLKVALTASSTNALIQKINEALKSNDAVGIRSQSSSSQILGVFTGQGAQWAQMGRQLLLHSKQAAETIAGLEQFLNDLPPADRPTWSLREELLKDDTESRIGEAELSQPLCTALQVMLVDLLRSAGVVMESVVGHSSGEIAAAYAAGLILARDAIRIAYYRGFHAHLARSASGERGAMMAVGASLQYAEQLCKYEFSGRISIAASNSSSSVTLSGDQTAIEEAKAMFDEKKIFTRLLKVDTAYHSHHMLPCSDPYVRSLQACSVEIQEPPPGAPIWYSSVYSGKEMDVDQSLKEVYWKENMVNTVLFSQALEAAIAGMDSCDLALEVGAHPALKGPAIQTLQEHLGATVPYLGVLERKSDDVSAFSGALGSVWSHLGASALSFAAYDAACAGNSDRRLVHGLPTYAWDHERRFWYESRKPKAARSRTEPVHQLLGRQSVESAEDELRWTNILKPKEIPWLSGHQLQGQTIFPAAGYIAMAMEAAMIWTRGIEIQLVEMFDFEIRRSIPFDERQDGVEVLISLTVSPLKSDGPLTAHFRCCAALHKDSTALTLISSGQLKLHRGPPNDDVLPPRVSPPPCLDKVQVDRFYSSLSELGFGYNGAFKALKSIERRLGYARGSLADPASDPSLGHLLVHPATLDLGIQALIPAFSYPYDGGLWSIHVPKRMDRIAINPHLCLTRPQVGSNFQFDAITEEPSQIGVSGDLRLFNEDGRACLIDVEGLKLIPLFPATSADDVDLFMRPIWPGLMPDAQEAMKSISSAVGDRDGSRKCMVAVAKQIHNRNSRMRILQIGAADNDFTHDLLRSLESFYVSYTITDDSSKILETAQQSLSQYARKLVFQQLDIQDEKVDDVPIATYDMVVIPQGISQGASPEAVLNNVRRLLKPGAYLLLAESAAACPIASKPPSSGDSLKAAQWNYLLKSTGYSGVLTMTDMPPSSDSKNVVLSQATDPRIDLLSNPLQIPSSEISIEDLVIIGGATSEVAKLAEELEYLLGSWSIRTNRYSSVEDIQDREIPSGCAVISLAELDKPLFKNYSAHNHAGLTSIISRCDSIVWVTRGGQYQDPYARMMTGFMRSFTHESPHIYRQMIDIAPGEKAKVNTLAASLLRLQFWAKLERAGEIADLSYTLEAEIMVEDGRLRAPRVVQANAANDRYNASKRAIETQANPGESALHVRHNEGDAFIHQPSSSIIAPATAEDGNNLRIRVLRSTLFAVRIRPSSYLHIVLGEVISTGKQLLALSKTNSSIIEVPASWTREIEVSPDRLGDALHSVLVHLLIQPVLSALPADSTLLVHEPPPAISSALQRVTQTLPYHIVFTTTATSGQRPPYITLHPHLCDRDLKAKLPTDVAMVLDFSNKSSSSGAFGKRIAHALDCHIEDTHDLFNTDTFLPRPTGLLDISLAEALQYASGAVVPSSESEGLQEVTLNNLPASDASSHLNVVDWTAHQAVMARVEPVDTANIFKPNKTYMLVGLTGDIGRLLCEWMIDHGARYVVLTSRNPRLDEQWLAQIQRAGATVKTLPLDVSNRASLHQLYDQLSSALPPIAGVANGAMVLRDAHFEDSTHDDFNDVLKPKVDGSIYLDELFSGDKNLDWFILFSSVVYWTGNRGQSAYGTANAFLSGLAAQRRHRGLPAAVVHLGVVMGAGYASQSLPHTTQMTLRRDYGGFLSQRDLLCCFAECVVACQNMDSVDVVTGGALDNVDLKKTLWYTNPILQRLTRPGDIGDGARITNGQNSVLAQLAAATSSDAAFEVLQQAFTAMLSEVLQLGEVSSSESSHLLDKPIDDLGVDSLIAVHIRKWFNDEVTVDIPVLKILGGLTVRELLQEAFDNMNHSAELASTEATESSNPTLREVPQSKPEVTSKHDARKSSEMSYGQARFWFLGKVLQDPTTFNTTLALRFDGTLRATELARAVDIVAQRHESLRTYFYDNEDGKPMQAVLPSPSLHLEQKTVSNSNDVVQEMNALKAHVYDVEKGENMRIILLHLSPAQEYLLVGYHHINMDGESFQVLLTDLEKAYQNQALSPHVLQYSGYAQRQRANAQNGHFDGELAYWRRVFPDLPEPLPLFPFGHTRVRQPQSEYDLVSVRLPLVREFVDRIAKASQKCNVSSFHFHLATLKVMLSRFLRTNDLCIGIADANRVDKDTMNAIGMYLNVLPLRFRSQPGRSFSGILRNTRATVRHALANSKIPFDMLLDELNVPRSSSHSPLFQAFMDYRGSQATAPFANLQYSVSDVAANRTPYDLSLDIVEAPEGVMITFNVQKSLYSLEEAEILARSYRSLLDAFSQDVGALEEAPPLFPDTDVETAIRLGRGKRMHTQWPTTVPGRIGEMVAQFGSEIALKDGSGNCLTYKQMSQRVNSIASVLIEKSAEGRIVAVFQEPSAEWACSVLAIMRVGAAYVPLDIGTPRARLAKVVQGAQPSVILAHSKTMHDVASLGRPMSEVVDVSHIPRAVQNEVQNQAKPDSIAAIMYTSGTTGTPKGIALKHSGFLNIIEGYIGAFNIGREVVLQQSPYSFDFSLSQIFAALLNGGTLVIVPQAKRGDPAEVAHIIAEEGITYTKATPAEYSSWIRFGGDQLLRSSGWKFAWGGGDTWPKELTSEFRLLNKPGLSLFNAYGPAETSLSIAKMQIPLDGDRSHNPLVGFPMPNTSIYIVDEQLRPVPVGVAGEIVVGGAGLSPGYVNNQMLTQEKFVRDPHADEHHVNKGWKTMYRTGDRGWLHADGALVFAGRVGGDSQIKLRGIRMELRDIENSILQAGSGGLAKAVVSVRGNNEFLVAHVEFANRGIIQEGNADLYLRQLLMSLPLPQYMRPAMLIPIDRIPLTANAKIDRRAVTALPLPALQESADNDGTELSPTETRLAQIWRSVLPSEMNKVVSIRASTDFFSLGGNSMLLVRVQHLIQETFWVSIPLVKLLDSITLGEMAMKIDASAPESIIDWDGVTSMAEVPLPAIEAAPALHSTKGKTVLLTGSSGHLGRAILKCLLADPAVTRIHCIAVRDNYPPPSAKVIVHEGNLAVPRLGLSAHSFSTLASTVDEIIHCGAKRAFFEPYRQLEGINVDATRELARLAVPRAISIQFFSSASVVEVACNGPSPETNGYIASKWASESILGSTARLHKVPIAVHRLSGADDIACKSDDTRYQVLDSMYTLSRRARVIPRSDGWAGYMDMAPVTAVAKAIVGASKTQNSGQGDPGASSLRLITHAALARISVDEISEGLLQRFEGRMPEGYMEVDPLKWMGCIKATGFEWLIVAQDIVRSDSGMTLRSRR
ncbi:hypothetical protein BDV96DRAFT_506848 [Lophiotrema nucula]|uniref:Carrier domain-containing protein n=1 Tax=Lophiotrema nucula TaxID=690887 RepID=A0A6A5YIU3_9PLEO|nr:hypothetical protein BDV96DRAFT_506848 [Lophiotrema nucula]